MSRSVWTSTYATAFTPLVHQVIPIKEIVPSAKIPIQSINSYNCLPTNSYQTLPKPTYSARYTMGWLYGPHTM